MLYSLEKIQGVTVQAENGRVGHVEDFFFDDVTWTIRYLVVDTGPWLFGREILIAPEAIGKPQWDEQCVPLNLSKKQVEESPEVDLAEPVSRQKQAELHTHYGWNRSWLGLQSPGVAAAPGVTPLAGAPLSAGTVGEEEMPNPHLRSVGEVQGYTVRAVDGHIGHVADFLAEDATWAIRYLVADMGDWLPGRTVLVAPSWIREIQWEQASVTVDLVKAKVEHSPAYDSDVPLDRQYEARLYHYYDRPVYW